MEKLKYVIIDFHHKKSQQQYFVYLHIYVLLVDTKFMGWVLAIYLWHHVVYIFWSHTVYTYFCAIVCIDIDESFSIYLLWHFVVTLTVHVDVPE